MKKAHLGTGLLLLAPALAACNEGSDHHSVGFDPLVTSLIQNQTTETGAPREVNGATFVFPENDDAFDDVLPLDNGPVVEQ